MAHLLEGPPHIGVLARLFTRLGELSWRAAATQTKGSGWAWVGRAGWTFNLRKGRGFDGAAGCCWVLGHRRGEANRAGVTRESQPKSFRLAGGWVVLDMRCTIMLQCVYIACVCRVEAGQPKGVPTA